MNNPLGHRLEDLWEMSSLSDEWWSMSWWDQTGSKGDDWERRMDAWHAKAVANGMEPLW